MYKSTLLCSALALALKATALHAAPIDWVGKALQEHSYTLERAAVSLRRPQGLEEKDPDPRRYALILSADQGPSLTLAQVPALPADLEAVREHAKQLSQSAKIHLAEALQDGFRISFELPGGFVRHKVWQQRDGVTVSCTAGVHGLLPSVDRTPVRRWLAEICDSMEVSPIAIGGAAAAAPAVANDGAGQWLQDPASGLRIRLPAGWVSQRDAGGGPIQFGNTASAISDGPGETGIGGMLFTGSAAQMGTDPVNLLERFVARTTNNANDRGKATALRINGRPAARLNYSGTVGGVRAVYGFYAICGVNNVLLIMGADGSRGKWLSALADMAMSASIQ